MWISYQVYEDVRKRYEEVKKSRDQTKGELRALKEAQAPMTRQIQEVDKQCENLDVKIKEKVGTLNSWNKFACKYCGSQHF